MDLERVVSESFDPQLLEFWEKGIAINGNPVVTNDGDYIF